MRWQAQRCAGCHARLDQLGNLQRMVRDSQSEAHDRQRWPPHFLDRHSSSDGRAEVLLVLQVERFAAIGRCCHDPCNGRNHHERRGEDRQVHRRQGVQGCCQRRTCPRRRFSNFRRVSNRIASQGNVFGWCNAATACAADFAPDCGPSNLYSVNLCRAKLDASTTILITSVFLTNGAKSF